MTDSTKFQFQWPFFGNQHIIDFLQASIENKQLANCYIFSGLSDIGKSTVARHFSASLLCQNFNKQQGTLPCQECANCQQTNVNRHSDINILEQETGKKNISIEQVREFIRIMQLGTFTGDYKIGIIKEAEKLSQQASNALLKILEEPRKKTVIILLTSTIDHLPKTIISRAQVLKFRPAPTVAINDYLVEKYNSPRELARGLARLSVGRPVRAVKLLENKDFLAEIKNITEMILNIMSARLDEKLRLSNELLSAHKGVELRQQTELILTSWQTVIRDAILLVYGLENLTVNESSTEKIKQLSLPISHLIQFDAQLKKSRRYLNASVNPQLVIEQLCYI